MAFSGIDRDSLPMWKAKETYSAEDIQAEQAEIQAAYQSMRFGVQFRQTVLACYKKCGGKVQYPFRVEPAVLMGK